MHRGEKKKHRIKRWTMGFTDAKPQENKSDLFPLWASVLDSLCVCVCGHWLWSVGQAWKDYRSGNNFTVCMGNCCDLFQWTEQILNREDHKMRKNERLMTMNEEVITEGIESLEQKVNRHKKNDLLSLIMNFFSRQNPVFSLNRRSFIFKHTLEVLWYCSLLDSVNPGQAEY